jgi:hypothetical protein
MEREAYERALKRAKSEGIRIVGEPSWDGNRSWDVRNPAHDGHYVVRLAMGARVLTCSCPARKLCKHRALVHEALEAERAAQAAAERLWRDPWTMATGERFTVGAFRAARESASRQAGLWG